MDPQQQPQPIADNTPQVEEPVVNVKQQVVEKVNGAKNVLVTVGSNASVDELVSALGLTFLLGKLGKHATAVFSGETPPAIDFLDPDKTFERSVDSLRDFIIALDKEKADKLRYKVEDDVVKVFITPYKTTISEKDLQFSQGDYNVDVVIAIGITKREDLDKAIVAHGRILHDAEVLTINANDKKSSLGSVDWSDSSASSVAEMLVSVSESFGSGLIDEQISTAFLTGIVAETNRFSNEKTSPKVMTMAAQLMAAGANQQLIASNLRQEGMISESIRDKKMSESHEDDAEMVLNHDDDKKSGTKDIQSGTPKKQPPPEDQKVKNTDKSIDQPKPNPPKGVKSSKPPVPVELPTPTDKTADPKPDTKIDQPVTEVSSQLPPDLPPVSTPDAKLTEAQSPQPLVEPESKQEVTPDVQPKHEMIDSTTQSEQITNIDADKEEAQRPAFGGTLNATTGQAEQDRIEQEARDREYNNQTLEHGGGDSSQDAIEAARAALDEVASEMPFDPAKNPTQSVGAQQLPPIHDDAPKPADTSTLTPIETTVPDTSAGKMQEDAVAQKSMSQAEPSPVDAFMQPHTESPQSPNPINSPDAVPATAPGQNQDLPPLPPMPPMPTDSSGGMLPPPPPAPSVDPTAGFKPQVGPEFMQGMTSQNSWTEAGQDVAAKQAEKDAARQAKLDQLGAQYDAAADKNREIQGLPPVNDDHTTFPLPPTS